MRRRCLLPLLALLAVMIVAPAIAQRRVTPVNTPATRTQSRNDKEGDSARALERRRLRSRPVSDEPGNYLMLDTLTGVQWFDSTMLPKAPPMKHPLLHAVNVSVNLWDPVMRIFGQHHGLIGFAANVSLHNRYLPTFEFGLGTARNKPSDMNFTYRSPIAPFFKLGADYNFLYNSSPDYQFFAGVRYGFSAFKFHVDDCTAPDNYWGETGSFSIPSASVTAGWLEVGLGLKVKLWGPISAGWGLRYHTILHQSHPSSGDAWYIPGYGTASSSLSGVFNITYTIPLCSRNAAVADTAVLSAPVLTR